jgi:hypothetical protein
MTPEEIAEAYMNCQTLDDIAQSRDVDGFALIGQTLEAVADEASSQVDAGQLPAQDARRVVDAVNALETDWRRLLAYNHCDLLN